VLSSSFYLFSSPILSRRRLDVYHTSMGACKQVQGGARAPPWILA